MNQVSTLKISTDSQFGAQQSANTQFDTRITSLSNQATSQGQSIAAQATALSSQNVTISTIVSRVAKAEQNIADVRLK